MQRLQLETLLADLRQSLRALRRNPSFTLAFALAALTVGISGRQTRASLALSTGFCSRRSPTRTPNAWVQLEPKYPAGIQSRPTPFPSDMVWRNNDVLFIHFALLTRKASGFNAQRHRSSSTSQRGSRFQPDYFKVFAVSPIMGRGFTQTEDLPNGPEAALISENLWRRLFGSDPGILNRTISLNFLPYPIVGVIPSSFVANPGRRYLGTASG